MPLTCPASYVWNVFWDCTTIFCQQRITVTCWGMSLPTAYSKWLGSCLVSHLHLPPLKQSTTQTLYHHYEHQVTHSTARQGQSFWINRLGYPYSSRKSKHLCQTVSEIFGRRLQTTSYCNDNLCLLLVCYQQSFTPIHKTLAVSHVWTTLTTLLFLYFSARINKQSPRPMFCCNKVWHGSKRKIFYLTGFDGSMCLVTFSSSWMIIKT